MAVVTAEHSVVCADLRLSLGLVPLVRVEGDGFRLTLFATSSIVRDPDPFLFSRLVA